MERQEKMEEAWAACLKACAAYKETSAANDTAWAACDKAWNAYIEACQMATRGE